MDHKLTLRLIFSGSEDSVGLGRGVVRLLEAVDETGSLNAAARGMGMAYSRAWTLLRKVEGELGFSLLCRNGAHGSAAPTSALEQRLHKAVLRSAAHVPADNAAAADDDVREHLLGARPVEYPVRVSPGAFSGVLRQIAAL